MTAQTTFRLELLKFYPNMFPGNQGFSDTGGWKCHFAKNYLQSIKIKDVKWFVKETLKQMKADQKYLKKESVQFISNNIYINYKYTIDDECIAFVLKSKTEMNRNDDRGFWLARFFRFIGRSFKTKYNNSLETLKIK